MIKFNEDNIQIRTVKVLCFWGILLQDILLANMHKL